MRLNDRYDGSNVPFQGDRTLLLRSIPVNARIKRAAVTITPVDATKGANPFAETITFNGPSGAWGATKTVAPNRWVEVDFHARRTMAGVTGTNLINANLQVDLGGAYLEINENGGVKTPDNVPLFTLRSDSDPLPGLTVTKLKLTKAASGLDIKEVVIRSVPANVTLRLGTLPPFFTHVGEMARAETTPDFAAILQAALADEKTKVENGFYELPVVIHSDTIARLTVALEIDYLVERNVTPPGLGPITLEYDLSTRPKTEAGVFKVEVPANTRVARRGVSVRATGTFEDTRIVHGFGGVVSASKAVDISGTVSHAQPVELKEDTLATAVDLSIGVESFANLQLDIRDDLDGKPGNVSLLPAPVTIELSGRSGLKEEGKTDAPANWVSLELGAEFQFKAGKTAWLVLQSLEGNAVWSVQNAPLGALRMQQTKDGGLSWRDAGPAQTPLAGLFRLRRKPKSFEMPLVLEVGDEDKAVRVSLEKFQPLGRLDFTLDFDEVTEAFNNYIEKTAPAPCPVGEHVINGNFERWLRIGDRPRPPTRIGLSAAPQQAPSGVVVTPDGARGFVAQVISEGSGLLQIIDVACDKTAGIIPLTLEPRSLAISPQGHRIYVSDGQRLQIVDTLANQAMGAPFDLQTGVAAELQSQVRAVLPSATAVALNGYWVSALALSPDGGRLYVIENLTVSGSGFQPSTLNRIRAIDAANLERLLTGSQVTFENISLAVAQLDTGSGTGAPAAGPLAASSDGKLLYTTVFRNVSTTALPAAIPSAELRVLDAATFQTIGTPVTLSGNPTSMALASGDRFVLVALGMSKTVAIVDAARPGSPALIAVALPPVAIAVSPEGKRAYVVGRDNNGSDSTLSIIDLTRTPGQISEVIPVGSSSRAVTLTPQGDRIYVAGTDTARSDGTVFSIQVGARLPEEWNLTSGTVEPVCVGEPFHLIAALGSLAQAARPMRTALSQLVPVTASCSYEFSFMGRSTDPDAVAEVFWLSKECGQLGDPVNVPIEAGEVPTPPPSLALPPISAPPSLPAPPPAGPAATAQASASSGAANQIAPLVLHRKRLTAPADADQAEIRFNVPALALAGIDHVSLIATAEATENSDLKLHKNGELQGWNVLPAAAPGFSMVAVDDGIELRNFGADPVDLFQTTEVRAGEQFILEVEGQMSLRETARSNPRVELRWLGAEGAAAQPPTVMEISPANFGVSTATGIAPAEARQVEVHMIVPGGVAQVIRRVSLSFSPMTTVPFKFIAHAQGDLVISDFHVLLEKVESAPPPVPKKGLCGPTPPGRQPGNGNGDCCFCPSCGAEQPVVGATPMETRFGRPAAVGHCSKCGTESVRFGGARVTGAQAMSIRSSPIHQPLLFTPTNHSIGEAAVVINGAPAPAPPLTAIGGIGEVRARKLTEAGIDSVAKLAGATPQKVAEATGVIEKVALEFIAEAKKLSSLRGA